MGRSALVVAACICIAAALVAALFLDPSDVRAKENRDAEGLGAAAADLHGPTLAASNEDGPRDEAAPLDAPASKPAVAAGQSEEEALGSAFAFRGTVLDPARKPLSGAEVTVVRNQGQDGSDATRAVTDDQGRFLIGFTDRTQRSWGARIEARAPGFSPSFLSDVPTNRGVNDVGPIVVYPAVALSGRVVDPEGRGVAGAEVYVFTVQPPADVEELWPKHAPAAVTGPDGAYAVSTLPPGTVTVGATFPGYADALRPGTRLKAEAPNVVDLALGVEDAYEGTVVDDQGTAVAKARVLAQRGFPRSAFWRGPTETDAQGKFRIAGLDRNRRDMHLQIQKVGFSQFWSSGSELPPDSRFTLRRAAALMLRVERTEGGDAPAIRAVRLERRSPRTPDRWMHAGEVQKFMREVVEPHVWKFGWENRGILRATAVLEGGAVARTGEVDLRPQDNAAGSEIELVARIEAPGSVAGRVLRQDQTPVAKLRVELLPDSNAAGQRVGFTREDGSFEFAGVQAGSYKLGARSADWITDTVPVPVAAGEARGGFELVARKPSRVYGMLTIGGQPPGEAIPVSAYRIDMRDRNASWEIVGTSTATPSGEFSIAPVPAGRIGVVPKRRLDPDHGAIRAYWNETPQPNFNPDAPTPWRWVVEVPPEGAAEILVDVPELRPSALYGSVVINGQGRAGVHLWVHGMRENFWRSETTDAEGKFRVKLDKGGEFWVNLHGEGFNEGRKAVVAEGEEQEMRFTLTTGGLEGSVADRAGRGVAVRVQLRRQREAASNGGESWSWDDSLEMNTKADGTFSFPEIPAGTYQVIATDSKRKLATAASAKFIVGFKERYTVPTLVVPPATPLRVRARNAEGKPAGGRLTITAAPGAAPLAQPYRGSIGKSGATRVHGLPPGPVLVQLKPNGAFAPVDQVVTLPDDGSTTTIDLELKPKEAKEGEGAGDPSAVSTASTLMHAHGNDDGDDDWQWSESFESVEFNSGG